MPDVVIELEIALFATRDICIGTRHANIVAGLVVIGFVGIVVPKDIPDVVPNIFVMNIDASKYHTPLGREMDIML